MPDYQLDEEQEIFRRTVREFAEEVVAPRAAAYDESGEFPYDVVKQMGGLGLFGLPFPEEYGGMGGDYFTLCLALEELARIDSSVAITLEAGVSLGAMPIYRFGSQEQKARWLPDLVAGTGLGAFGLTEPGGGSDTAATRTTARSEDGEWVVDGTKCFITNAGTEITKLVTVTAVTGQRNDAKKEISAIVVPVPSTGLSISRKYSKVGWHASDTRELSFADCRVPEANLLGERGHGLRNFLSILDEGRIAISAIAVGLAQGCLEESVRYANERNAFGSPIGAYQSIAFQIADMQTRTHLARLAYYDAAARMLAGRPFATQASMAKLYSSQIAVDNARTATQIFGGYGFMNEYPVARHWRDAKILEIGEGTSEVQRMLIARELGLPPHQP